MAWPKRTVVWWEMRGAPIPRGVNPLCIRPCLESACSEFFGSRDVTICAIDDLERTDVCDSDLEALASSGILIRHVGRGTRGLMDDMNNWVDNNPPSAAIMMLICRDYKIRIQDEFKALGYTFIRPHLWTRNTLLEQMSRHVSPHVDGTHKHKDESPWFCLVCKYPSSTHRGIMDHLNGSQHKTNVIENDKKDVTASRKRKSLDIGMQPASKVPKKLKAVVWWDINSCRVPNNHDSSCVRQSIQSALYNSFGSLPYTIFAMGNLKRIPCRTIKSLSSSGIFFRHTILGSQDICTALIMWTIYNPPPAVIILISDDVSDDVVSSEKELIDLEVSGYTVIRAYPGATNSREEWLWENLIEETLVELVEDKCDDMDEPLYSCTHCEFPTCNYQSFANHLRGVEHANEEQFVKTSRRIEAARRLKNNLKMERAYYQDLVKNNHLNDNEEQFVERI